MLDSMCSFLEWLENIPYLFKIYTMCKTCVVFMEAGTKTQITSEKPLNIKIGDLKCSFILFETKVKCHFVRVWPKN